MNHDSYLEIYNIDGSLTEYGIGWWKNTFKNESTFAEYLHGLAGNGLTNEHLLFSDALSHIGFHRCNPQKLHEFQDQYYRVMATSEFHVPKEEHTNDIRRVYCRRICVFHGGLGQHVWFPPMFGYKLQLLANSGRFVDYLIVKNSEVTAEKLGLFAAQEFPKNTLIGYFCGQTAGNYYSRVGESREVIAANTYHPNNNMADMYDREDNTYNAANKVSRTCNRNGFAYQHCLVRDNEGCLTISRTTSLENLLDRNSEISCRIPFFMGAHYAIDSTMPFPGQVQNELAKNINAYVEEDGALVCLKKIPKNSEIIVSYLHGKQLQKVSKNLNMAWGRKKYVIDHVLGDSLMNDLSPLKASSENGLDPSTGVI